MHTIVVMKNQVWWLMVVAGVREEKNESEIVVLPLLM
jgi:hypothetical protein